MADQVRQSPSPSEVGFQLHRRSVLKGAAALGGVAAFGGILAACGDDDDTAGSGDGGPASGTVRVGSNYSDAKPNEALKAALDALPNEDITIELNEVDHNTYQETITSYMQDPPDDVAPWFAAYRLVPLASAGLLTDISDVWTDSLDSVLSEGFKGASTYDGKQYLVPWSFYSWGIHYRKSVWESVGATPPETWDELLALCETLDGLGVTPFAFGNDGRWPAMGTFDQLNFRLNGYQYHVDLMAGRESWTDDRTKAVFERWATLLPYHQSDPNGREWQDAGNALVAGEAAMMTIGNFVGDLFPNEELDDLDFFPFPTLNDEHGQDTVEAPIDGWVMTTRGENEAGAKEVLAHMGTALAQDTYLSIAPGVQAPNSNVDTSVYNALQTKSAALVQNAKHVTQFLDRDTLPAFANEAGQAFADFFADPGNIDAILEDLQGKAEALLGG
jgi:multiple sugar transport system substrate-binding protein